MFVKRFSKAIWVFNQKEIPSVIVETNNTNKFVVYKLKPTIINKNKDLWFLFQNIAYSDGTLDQDIIIKINDIQKCIDKKVMTLEQFHSFCSTGLKMSDYNFEHLFQIKPILRSNYENLTIIWPETIRESSKKKCIELLDKIKNILSSHGLLEIFTGKIVFRNNMKSAGLYYQTGNEIHINSTISVLDNNGLRTILHEFGHKWYYEFTNDHIKELIAEKYNKEISLLSNTYNVGDEIKYYGITRPEFKDKKIVIIDKTKDDFTIDIEGRQFKIDKKFFDLKANIFKKISDNDYFPTAYSKTSIIEWQAECFAFYLEDKLTKENKYFWHKIFSM